MIHLITTLWMMTGGPTGQALVTDSTLTTSRPLPIFQTRDALFAVSAVVIAIPLDLAIRNSAIRNRSEDSDGLAAIGNAFGTFTYLGPALATTWLAGTTLKRPAISRAAMNAAKTGLIAGVLANALKLGIGRARPNATHDHLEFDPFGTALSFPSGHTTLAFAVAASLSRSTRDRWSDFLFFAGAGLTGYARINDNKHWFSDVVAGAAVGILVERQLSRRSMKVTPMVSSNGVGFSLSVVRPRKD